MRPASFTLIFVFLTASMHYALATEEKESCGRLNTGDTFDDLNKPGSCINSALFFRETAPIPRELPIR